MGFSNGYDSGYADAVADMKRKGRGSSDGGSSGGGSSGAALNLAGIAYQVVAPDATPMFDSAKIPVVVGEFDNDRLTWWTPPDVPDNHFVILEYSGAIGQNSIGYDGALDAGVYLSTSFDFWKIGDPSIVRA